MNILRSKVVVSPSLPVRSSAGFKAAKTIAAITGAAAGAYFSTFTLCHPCAQDNIINSNVCCHPNYYTQDRCEQFQTECKGRVLAYFANPTFTGQYLARFLGLVFLTGVGAVGGYQAVKGVKLLINQE